MANHQPITEQRLEQALRQTAEIVARHGQQYTPILDRIAKELGEMRRRRQMLTALLSEIDPPTIDLQPVRGAA